MFSAAVHDSDPSSVSGSRTGTTLGIRKAVFAEPVDALLKEIDQDNEQVKDQASGKRRKYVFNGQGG
ncbi:hypothetical protein GCM10028825_07310 [Spirosoma agri]